MYQIGSIADIISGKTTNKSNKVSVKEIKYDANKVKNKNNKPNQNNNVNKKENVKKVKNEVNEVKIKRVNQKTNISNAPSDTQKPKIKKVNNNGVNNKQAKPIKSPKVQNNSTTENVSKNVDNNDRIAKKRPLKSDFKNSSPKKMKFDNNRQPFNNKGRPSNNTGRKFNNNRQPFNNKERPFNNFKKPFNNNGKQFNNNGKPFNNNGKRFNNNGKPFNNKKQPVRNNPDIKPRKPDPNEHKTIFVGNVSLDTKMNDLKRLFEQFGEVESLRFRNIPVPDLETSKKVAFIKRRFHPDRKTMNAYVVFKDEASTIKACTLNGTVFNDLHLRVDKAKNEKLSQKTYSSKTTIFIGNLPHNLEEEEVRTVFECCGPIESIRLIRSNRFGVGKGFGFVNFKNPDAVQLAHELQDIKFGNRTVNINPYKGPGDSIKKPRHRDMINNQKKQEIEQSDSENEVEDEENEDNEPTDNSGEPSDEEDGNSELLEEESELEDEDELDDELEDAEEDEDQEEEEDESNGEFDAESDE